MQIYQKEFMIFADFEPLTAVIDCCNNAKKTTSKLTSKRQRKEIELRALKRCKRVVLDFALENHV